MAEENKPETAGAVIRKELAELKDAIKTLGEKDQITPAVEAKFKAIEEDLKALEKKTVERQLTVPGAEEDLKKNPFDLHMAIVAAKTGNWNGAGYELEHIKATHQKALKLGFQPHNPEILHKDILAGTGANGGFLLSVEVDQSITPLAIASRPVLNDMGITKLNNLAVGDYHYHKQATRGTAYWIGELQAPTKSGQTFERRSLKMKKIAAYTACSNDMLRQGRGTMDSFVRQDLSDALGLGIETALHRGSGSDYQPRGLVNQSGLTTTTAVGANGGQVGLRRLALMANNIENADLLKGALGYVTHPRVAFQLRIQGSEAFSGQTTNTPPLNGQVPLSNAKLEELVGYKIRTTTLLPTNLTKGSSSDCTYVIFGDWSQLIMGAWGGLEIKVSDQASDGTNNMFVQDGFFVHVLQTMDIGLRDPAAFTILSDARVTTNELAA